MQGGPIVEALWPQIERLVANFVGKDQISTAQSIHLRRLIESFAEPQQVKSEAPPPAAETPPFQPVPLSAQTSASSSSTKLRPRPPVPVGPKSTPAAPGPKQSNLPAPNPKRPGSRVLGRWPSSTQNSEPTPAPAPRKFQPPEPAATKKTGSQAIIDSTVRLVTKSTEEPSKSHQLFAGPSSSSSSSSSFQSARDFFKNKTETSNASSSDVKFSPLNRNRGSKLPAASPLPIIVEPSKGAATLIEEDKTSPSVTSTPDPSPAPGTLPTIETTSLRTPLSTLEADISSTKVTASQDTISSSSSSAGARPQQKPEPRLRSNRFNALSAKFETTPVPCDGCEQKRGGPRPEPTWSTQRGGCRGCLENDVDLVRLPKCNHDPTLCLQCLTEWTAHRAAQAQEPRCGECKIPINYSDVKLLLKDDPNMFKIYESLKTGLLPEGYVWCAQPDCGAAQKPDADGVVSCRKCERRTCARHGALVLPKSGFCCEIGKADFEQEEQRRLQQNQLDSAASEAAILGLTKPCPSCGVKIEKNGGCMHMTCRCTYEWFWCCGRNYRDPSQAQMHRQQCQY